ncbi:GPR1/FUN34/yaaH family-domain-containing protein [Xylariaceae sp. FL1651]|nr:GPR1/FUN34/yaaH family-domain-containing protein [Xylariaceae sp. FL1651]
MASQQVFTDRDLEKQSASTIAPVHAHGHGKSKLASANPLGLLAFGQALFFLSIFEFAPRGVTVTNITVGNMIWMGGVAQFIAGIIDFCAGNAFGATVFCAYGAFNLAYSTIFIPGSGILDAYASKTGHGLDPSFSQAVALFVWSWFIITVIFTIGACQANYVLFGLLCCADITLILLASGHMTGSEALLKASGVFGLIAAAISFYAAAAYLYVDGVTPFTLPLFPIRKDRIV